MRKADAEGKTLEALNYAFIAEKNAKLGVEGRWNRFKEGWIDGTRSMRVALAIGR